MRFKPDPSGRRQAYALDQEATPGPWVGGSRADCLWNNDLNSSGVLFVRHPAARAQKVVHSQMMNYFPMYSRDQEGMQVRAGPGVGCGRVQRASPAAVLADHMLCSDMQVPVSDSHLTVGALEY